VQLAVGGGGGWGGGGGILRRQQDRRCKLRNGLVSEGGIADQVIAVQKLRVFEGKLSHRGKKKSLRKTTWKKEHSTGKQLNPEWPDKGPLSAMKESRIFERVGKNARRLHLEKEKKEQEKSKCEYLGRSNLASRRAAACRKREEYREKEKKTTTL